MNKFFPVLFLLRAEIQNVKTEDYTYNSFYIAIVLF